MLFERACLSAAGMLCCVTMFAGNVNAGNITNMRIGQQVGSVRIVFEADSKPEYRTFLLSEPKRLVVDVYDMNVKQALQSDKNNLIKQWDLIIIIILIETQMSENEIYITKIW